MTQEGLPHKPHYPALDGIRGIAILLVIVYHNFGFIDVFFFGWLGVDLFFVLSGFLITDILLRKQREQGFLKKFFIRRALRILPLYYLVLFVFLILLPFLEKNFLDLDYYISNQLWFWTYLQNWLLIFHPPEHAISLTHLWSLAVEEQYYLIWPFCILLIKKPQRLFFLLFIILLLVIFIRLIVWIYKIESLAYFNFYTFSRIDGICIGSMLALARKFAPSQTTKSFTAIIFLLASLNFIFYFINKQYDFSFPFLAIVGYTTFATVFGLLLNEIIVSKDSLIRVCFENKVLRFFGTISYGLYIIHWPTYIVLKTHAAGLFQSYFFHSANFMISMSATVISIIISYLSFHFYEKPFLKMKEKFL